MFCAVMWTLPSVSSALSFLYLLIVFVTVSSFVLLNGLSFFFSSIRRFWFLLVCCKVVALFRSTFLSPSDRLFLAFSLFAVLSCRFLLLYSTQFFISFLLPSISSCFVIFRGLSWLFRFSEPFSFPFVFSPCLRSNLSQTIPFRLGYG